MIAFGKPFISMLKDNELTLKEYFILYCYAYDKVYLLREYINISIVRGSIMIKATPIKFKNLPSDIKTRLNKLNGSGRKFVKDVYKDELLLYWKAAGGVGLVVYGELKFQKGFEKGNMVNLFYPLSNKMLEEKYGISRQSKYRAIKKLRRAGLIEYRIDAGKNVQCRLLTK